MRRRRIAKFNSVELDMARTSIPNVSEAHCTAFDSPERSGNAYAKSLAALRSDHLFNAHYCDARHRRA